MQVFHNHYRNGEWREPLRHNHKSQWVLAFGCPHQIEQFGLLKQLQNAYPKAIITGCSTSGEILGDALYDNSLCVTAITFESATVHAVSNNINHCKSSSELGQTLAQQLPLEQLRHVFVISDGQQVNGSELLDGLRSQLPHGIAVTGGLAGDADRFEKTYVWHNATLESGLVIAIGLYGKGLNIGFGHLGGWRPFGPERQVTQSKQNILYSIDDSPALALYKLFLGELASELPASALRYPLLVKESEQNEYVRTILSINEQDQSMLFAGNVPEGATVQLMHANYDDLLDGAEEAANIALDSLPDGIPSLAILISCIGRRLVLDQRAEEELELIAQKLPDSCIQTGFYSYGEISGDAVTQQCQLHNQTMTVTLLSEA